MSKRASIILLLVFGMIAFLLMDRFFDRLADTDSCVEGVAEATSTIVFSSERVSPACTLLSSGQTVTWVNRSGKTIQVSSDPHPVHSDNFEISGGTFVLQLEPGESSSVIVVRKGTFGFHDHGKPSLGGKIIIK